MSGKKFVLKLIETYRDLPCLWQSTHRDYHNKYKRNAALKELLVLFQKVDPNANKYTVQKKIASLRGAFKKELNKVKTSIRFGASADEVHVPKLWYYDKLSFLEKTDTPWPSVSPRPALDDTPFEESEETYNEDMLSPQSPASTSSKRSQSTKETSLKRTKSTEELVLNKNSSKLNTTNTTKHEKEKHDSSDAFGQYVAAEVRTLPDNMKNICKKIINDAIFQAAMGQLNFTSRVVTDPS